MSSDRSTVKLFTTQLYYAGYKLKPFRLLYWTGDSKFVSLSPLLMCWGSMVLNTILMLTALNIHLLLWNLFPEYAHCLFYISIWVTMRHVKLDLAQTEPFYYLLVPGLPGLFTISVNISSSGQKLRNYP